MNTYLDHFKEAYTQTTLEFGVADIFGSATEMRVNLSFCRSPIVASWTIRSRAKRSSFSMTIVFTPFAWSAVIIAAQAGRSIESLVPAPPSSLKRSEERRVGKEC